MDYTGEEPGAFENGQFSMEVNDPTEASPALRHNNGANILFADLHAATITLTTIKKPLRSPLSSLIVKSWQSEFVKGTTPVDLGNSNRTCSRMGLTAIPRCRWFGQSRGSCIGLDAERHVLSLRPRCVSTDFTFESSVPLRPLR